MKYNKLLLFICLIFSFITIPMITKAYIPHNYTANPNNQIIINKQGNGETLKSPITLKYSITLSNTTPYIGGYDYWEKDGILYFVQADRNCILNKDHNYEEIEGKYCLSYENINDTNPENFKTEILTYEELLASPWKDHYFTVEDIVVSINGGEGKTGLFIGKDDQEVILDVPWDGTSKNPGQVIISHIPNGVTYEVKEISAESPTGRKYNTDLSASWTHTGEFTEENIGFHLPKITDGSINGRIPYYSFNIDFSTLDETREEARLEFIKKHMLENDTVTINLDITNHLYGDLTLSKKVTGIGDKDKDWHFKITLEDSNFNETLDGVTFTSGVANVVLKDGESKTITNLPAGMNYSVEEEEANKDGYITKNSLASGKITAEENIQVTFENYLKEPDEPKEEIIKNPNTNNDIVSLVFILLLLSVLTILYIKIKVRIYK